MAEATSNEDPPAAFEGVPINTVTEDHPQSSSEDRPKAKVVKVDLTGMRGAGKKTLMRNFFDTAEESDDLTKRTACPKSNTKHGITFHIVHPRGLKFLKEAVSTKKMKKLFKNIGYKADMLLYCLSVSPGAKFDGNIETIKLLQDAFGKKIWKHCLVILTFSNHAIDQLKRKMRRSTKEQITSKYIEHLQHYVTLFSNELNKLGVKNVTVKTIFDRQLKPTPAADDTTTILAIPAGDDPEDQVLPDLAAVGIIPVTLGDELIHIPIKNWKDTILEIVRKSYGESHATITSVGGIRECASTLWVSSSVHEPNTNGKVINQLRFTRVVAFKVLKICA